MSTKRRNNGSVFHSYFVLAVGVVLGFASLTIFNIIYTEQETDFIDEIFHIPQARHYCQNQWTKWDPKITTLPGLYLVSYIFLKPFHLLAFENFCTVYTLRLTNVLATVINFFVVFKICHALEKRHLVFFPKFYCKVLTALNVALFPPLYFFTFLYYTDVWSTTFVLLMFYFHLEGGKSYKILGGVSGFMAVLMRQTNIIWVGLMILDDVWNILSKSTGGCGGINLVDTKAICKELFLNNFTSKKSKFYKTPFTLIVEFISKSYPYIIVCLLFVTFVFVNESIVLGDKKAHAATFHPMQFFYFLDFLAFFGWPFIISEVPSLWKKPVKFSTLVRFIVLCAVLSEANKLEHPYLLADNRHLAFYLWKKIFGHVVFRRVAVVTYAIAGLLLMRHLKKRRVFMFPVLLTACTILNLTPQYLFELRYFIIPFIFYRLQFKQTLAVVIETIFYIGVNFGVIYLFLNKPFVWPNEPNVVQRFIW